MQFDVLVTRDAHCVRVRVEGEAGVGRVLSLMRVLELDSRDWPQPVVLLDLRSVEPPLDEAGRAQVAAAVARSFPTLRRAAMLVAPRGRGSAEGVRIFDDEDAAREWLES